MSHAETADVATPVDTASEPPVTVGAEPDAVQADSGVTPAEAPTGESGSADEGAPLEVASSASEMSAETAKAFADARDRLQEAVSSGLDHGQGVLDQFGAGRDQLAALFGSGLAQTPKQFADFNAKAMEAWRSNTEALMAHWQSLSRVSSWSELIALSAEHARKQIEAMTAQARDLSALAGKIAQDAGQLPSPSKHDGQA